MTSSFQVMRLVMLKKHPFDVITLSETWLKNTSIFWISEIYLLFITIEMSKEGEKSALILHQFQGKKRLL